jgi:Zn finger protein HypA/HybF involved in hydrogenase expression
VSKVIGIKKAEPKCMHCGRVPESEHPGFSCPRIASSQMDSDGSWAVEYIETFEITFSPVPPDADEPPSAA